MKKYKLYRDTLNRRDLLRKSMTGLGISAGIGALGSASLFGRAAEAAAAQAAANGKVLVVLELSGGNDGLNTVVPYGDDAYYRHRPNIGLPRDELRVLDDHFGLNRGMAGFERLYKDGKMAIVHGCGYDNPSFSHFTSMAYWHTAAPNSGDEYGWVGRLADAMEPSAPANFLVNIAARQSLAVRSERHVPVVFDAPNRFMRESFFAEKEALAAVPDIGQVENQSRRYLLDIARSANDASALVREAWSNYSSPIDYGVNGLDLPKVVAMLDAGMPTGLYYVAYRNNAFDTHVFQNNVHQRMLTYTSDAVSAFIQDLERIGRADDVALMIFSEFGRRVPENVSLGTDHGAANVMFVVGNQVKGGHYGELPSLTNLMEGDNLPYTTDFRRVYQTMIQGWLGHTNTAELLNGDFEAFDLFT
ncbi:MAG: DUF1501 domain-containing protein [Gammaproteobacteria bacterium]|jgi:uncharacterized protein (DUF1501 family)|nr:DUF1501 domain-containing protein [Gammaproteobacteria bacterium]HJO11940.1 DUF1501 domain-containing protein [Gammaproteobacteria bacterium]|tara:strand:- start:362 stop:1612 length:1251 start_codon:yes stop_codon:yes gene_type:complete